MPSQPNSRKIPWHLLLIFCCLSLGILLIGYIYYQHQVAHIKQDKQNDLAAIMDLKIRQIVNWRQERLGDATVILKDRLLALRIKDYFERKEAPRLKEDILEHLAAFMIYQYQKIILISGQGGMELSYPPERRACDSYTQKLVAEVRQRKEIIFSDLYLDDVANEIRLCLGVPILAPQDQTLVGIILLKIDPQQFLYPLLQTWPTPSRTAETELFRKEGNEVVFLNELRRRQGSALTLHFPIDSPQLCAAMVARGVKGVFEGRDYRDKRVIAAGGAIPDSSWFILAKVDAVEIFAPLAAYARMTGLLLLALVAGSGLGLAYVWRNQQAVFYRRQFETEHDKLVLAQRYEYLTRYANDIILLADQDWRLVEANERAVESFGYGRDELLRLSLPDLHPPETRPWLTENLQRAGERDGQIFEASQQRRDGTTFPAEISLRLMEVDGHKVYQEIIRDVTERKLAEEALRRSEGHLAEAQRIAHLGSWEWDILTDTITWSDEVYQIYGLPLHSPPPSYQDFVRCLHPDDREMVKEKVDAALKGEEPYCLDFRIVRPDGTVRIVHNEAEVIFNSSGKPVSLVGIEQDITESKRAEADLRHSEARLAEAQRMAHLGNWELDLRQYTGTWNDEVSRIFGLAPQEEAITYETFLSLIHPEDLPTVNQEIAKALTSGEYGPYDFRIIRADGSIRFLHAQGEVRFDQEGRPLRLVGVVLDITERKLAEEALRRSEGRLTEAQRMAHLGNCEWDLLQNTLSWNDEIYRIFGLAPEEFQPSYPAFLRMVHPNDLATVKLRVEEALKSGRYGPYDFRIIRPDGSIRFLHAQGEVRFDQEGRPLRLVGTVQDITELKRTEEALRESEKSLQHLTEQLLTAQESERQRISLVLHDELGQALILFKFQISAIKDNLRKEKNVAANDCQDVLQYLDGLIDKVRQLSRDLGPPRVLEDLGFQGALKYLIREFSKHYHIQRSKVDIAEIEPLISREAVINIYRIFQECLINIGRHAHASQITIEVKKQKDQVVFMIQDNGRGLDLAQRMGQSSLKPGLGLPSIQERVRILGGAINIWSKPGQGTKISFTLPIKLG